MSRVIIFHAPPHHTLTVEGVDYPGGSTIEVSDEQAEELLTASYVNCTLAEEDTVSDDRPASGELREPQQPSQTGSLLTGMGTQRPATLTEQASDDTSDKKEN